MQRKQGIMIKINSQVICPYGEKTVVSKFYDDFSAIAIEFKRFGDRWLNIQKEQFDEYCLDQIWVKVTYENNGIGFYPLQSVKLSF
jgi:hypothetical protein